MPSPKIPASKSESSSFFLFTSLSHPCLSFSSCFLTGHSCIFFLFSSLFLTSPAPYFSFASWAFWPSTPFSFPIVGSHSTPDPLNQLPGGCHPPKIPASKSESSSFFLFTSLSHSCLSSSTCFLTGHSCIFFLFSSLFLPPSTPYFSFASWAFWPSTPLCFSNSGAPQYPRPPQLITWGGCHPPKIPASKPESSSFFLFTSLSHPCLSFSTCFQTGNSCIFFLFSSLFLTPPAPYFSFASWAFWPSTPLFFSNSGAPQYSRPPQLITWGLPSPKIPASKSESSSFFLFTSLSHPCLSFSTCFLTGHSCIFFLFSSLFLTPPAPYFSFASWAFWPSTPLFFSNSGAPQYSRPPQLITWGLPSPKIPASKSESSSFFLFTSLSHPCLSFSTCFQTGHSCIFFLFSSLFLPPPAPYFSFASWAFWPPTPLCFSNSGVPQYSRPPQLITWGGCHPPKIPASKPESSSFFLFTSLSHPCLSFSTCFLTGHSCIFFLFSSLFLTPPAPYFSFASWAFWPSTPLYFSNSEVTQYSRTL